MKKRDLLKLLQDGMGYTNCAYKRSREKLAEKLLNIIEEYMVPEEITRKMTQQEVDAINENNPGLINTNDTVSCYEWEEE